MPAANPNASADVPLADVCVLISSLPNEFERGGVRPALPGSQIGSPTGDSGNEVDLGVFIQLLQQPLPRRRVTTHGGKTGLQSTIFQQLVAHSRIGGFKVRYQLAESLTWHLQLRFPACELAQCIWDKNCGQLTSLQ